ncbi:MAG: TlpA family protein disulfide reductase [Planctomycetes bacterium]|nr:TlpA family protein disulfide reductase [Planctomycetota bacterium]
MVSSLRTVATAGASLALLLGGCGEPNAPVSAPRSIAGAAVEVVDLQGLEAFVHARKGRPLLVNFWATWCGPCVAELPELVAATRPFRAAGGEVAGVCLDLMAPGYEVDTVLPKLPAFLAARGIDYANLLFSEYECGPLGDRFGFDPVLPVTLAIGASGEIVEIHEGRADAARFAALAERARQGS